MKAALAEAGLEALDVTIMGQGAKVDWGDAETSATEFKTAMAAPQANGPVTISASGRGDEAEFSSAFHDTDYTLRDAAEVVLQNLTAFAAATSGLSSVARTEIFGPTGSDQFPLVMLQGQPISCGWNPPEFGNEFSDLPEITAFAHSDDFKIEVDIDARPYLATADVEHLKILGEDGWQGDYTADEIFHRAESAGCPGARNLQDYLDLDVKQISGDDMGFEVSIDEEKAMAWLEANRPEVHAALTAEADAPSP